MASDLGRNVRMAVNGCGRKRTRFADDLMPPRPNGYIDLQEPKYHSKAGAAQLQPNDAKKNFYVGQNSIKRRGSNVDFAAWKLIEGIF